MRFDDSKVTYEVTAEPDDIEVRGNAMASGNDEFDRRVENEILERCAGGDVWAWASVKVTARYDDIDSVEGVDYLGGCSYADEDDFKQAGGYYDDMKKIARDDLFAQLEAIHDTLTADTTG